MQTILLATAETKSLQPLTDTIPSPMLPVLNRPVMSYQLEVLARQGVEECLVCVHHYADQIEQYFGTGEWWKLHLDYLLQPEPYGTAGSLKWAEHSINNTFLCLPADAIHQIDISALWNAHKASGCMATSVVSRRSPLDRTYYQVKERGQETNQSGKQPVEMHWYNTGVYLLEPKVLEFIPKRKKFDISSQLIPALLTAGLPVGIFELNQFYKVLDSFESYTNLQWHLLENCCYNREPSPILAPDWISHEVSKWVWVGRNNKIHPKADLIAPVVIGENTYIGSGAQVGPNAVIGSNVIVDDDATVSHSIVFDQTYVGMRIKIENYLVNQNLVVEFQNGTSLAVADPAFLNNTSLTRFSQKISRLADILVAACLLLALAPLQLVIMFWLLLSHSPLFQYNVCLTKQPSQSIYSPSIQIQTARLLQFNVNKPTSKWIEKLGWHRIPELWNVLKGDMKLVGLSHLTTEEAQKIPEICWHLRQNHAPGFTGLWYVQDSESDNQDDLIVADAYYFATHTFWQDISIIARTPFAWWRKTFRPQPHPIGQGEISNAV